MHEAELVIITHRNKIQEEINIFCKNLQHRATIHDLSKLKSPEFEIFKEYAPKLKYFNFGSDEYKQCLADMKPALDHHYANNSHHPEYHENGIKDMNLLDIFEMFCDWKVVAEDMKSSLDICQERFKFSDELKQIFLNSI